MDADQSHYFAMKRYFAAVPLRNVRITAASDDRNKINPVDQNPERCEIEDDVNWVHDEQFQRVRLVHWHTP